MKLTPFLDFYYVQMCNQPMPLEEQYPVLPGSGLCSCLYDFKYNPDDGNVTMKVPAKYKTFREFLLCADTSKHWERFHMFGPIRQNVILLCAVMNGELE